MGLDAFKTKSSTKTGSGSSSTGSTSKPEDGKSSSGEPTSEESELKDRDVMPWFTVVWDRKADKIKTYKGRNAFLSRKTPAHQKFLVNIPDKFDYKRIKAQFKQLKQSSIEEFLEEDQEYGIDMIERLQSDKLEKHKTDCEVCGEELLVIGDDYIEFQGKYIHPEHNIKDVEDQMGVE